MYLEFVPFASPRSALTSCPCSVPGEPACKSPLGSPGLRFLLSSASEEIRGEGLRFHLPPPCTPSVSSLWALALQAKGSQAPSVSHPRQGAALAGSLVANSPSIKLSSARSSLTQSARPLTIHPVAPVVRAGFTKGSSCQSYWLGV